MDSLRLLPTLLLLGTLAAGTCQAQKYTVVKLQTLPGGTGTSAAHMNKAGEVVGSADDSTGESVAVKWSGLTPSIVYDNDVPPLPGPADGTGINNSGVVVGNFITDGAGIFVSGPNVSNIQVEDHPLSLYAINDADVIVGAIQGHPAVWAGVDLNNFTQFDAAILPTTTTNYADSTPSGINSAGVIVGTEDDFLPDFSNTYPVAVRWSPDPITHAPGARVKALVGLGGKDSGASTVNANGWVVGWATLGNNLQRAVLWEGNNGPFDLGTVGGKESSAGGINAEGDVAGQAQTASGAWHAVLWTHLDFKATDLNLEISPALAKQFTLTSAADTNDRCMVLANGVDNKTGAPESFVLSLSDQSKCNEP